MKYDPDQWPACWILSLIAAGNVHGFYVSREWKAMSAKVRRDQRGRCWDCMHKHPAKLRRGVTVHHVHPIRERPDLALSEYDEYGNVNLVCLCSSCHWERHHQRRAISIPERW